MNLRCMDVTIKEIVQSAVAPLKAPEPVVAVVDWIFFSNFLYMNIIIKTLTRNKKKIFFLLMKYAKKFDSGRVLVDFLTKKN